MSGNFKMLNLLNLLNLKGTVILVIVGYNK